VRDEFGLIDRKIFGRNPSNAIISIVFRLRFRRCAAANDGAKVADRTFFPRRIRINYKLMIEICRSLLL